MVERTDTVRQRDRDGLKDRYDINAVRCATQWQPVACCERIGQAFLLPVIALLFAYMQMPASRSGRCPGRSSVAAAR